MSSTAIADDGRIDSDPARYECRICWYLYDPAVGDPLEQIPAGTAFQELPDHWRCPQCDAEQFAFLPVHD
jgi:rubredoxin